MSRHSRSSVSRALRRIVDATEDLVDDVLDRAEDFEHDVRHSLSRAVDDEDRSHRRQRREQNADEEPEVKVPRMRAPDELDGLREQIESLTHRIEQLSDAQR